MGGASCKHSRTAIVKESEPFVKNIFFKSKIVTKTCLDCPSQWQDEVTIGRLTQFQYASHILDKTNCDHKYFKVDESTVEKSSESTLLGSVARLFLGPSLDGIQYHWYLTATAKCQRCEFKFLVKSEFEKVWRDQKQIEQRSTDWIPVKQTITITSTQNNTKEVFVQVVDK